MPVFGVRTLFKSAAAVGGSVCLVLAYGTNNNVKAAKRQSWHFHEPSTSWDSNWDKREPASLLKPSSKDSPPSKEMLDRVRSKASRHLFLVRHGQYHLNNGKKQLTPLGKKQADLIGLRFKELALPYTTMIRSTKARAMETAELIAQHLPSVPVVDSDLIQEGIPIAPQPPVAHISNARCYEDGARFEAAFRKYFHRAEPSQTTDSYEIMVCHGNIIGYFVCRALQLPPETMLRLSLHNGSITWLVIHPNGQVVLKSLGDAGHIPSEHLSST